MATNRRVAGQTLAVLLSSATLATFLISGTAGSAPSSNTLALPSPSTYKASQHSLGQKNELKRGQEWAERAATALGLGPRETLTAINAFTRDVNYTDAVFTVVYERQFAGLPVNGLAKATFTTEGNVRRTTRVVPIPNDLTVTPTIDAPTAIRAATKTGLTTTDKPQDAQLVIHTRPTPTLAWRVEMHAADGTGPLQVIISADKGKIIERTSTRWAIDGVGHSLYSGTVGIRTEQQEVQPGQFTYEMRDDSRGGHYVIDYATQRVYRKDVNVWGDGTENDPMTVAADAHYGAANYWDYLSNVHGWRGYKDNGESGYSVVHNDDELSRDNAIWDSRCDCVTYGIGDGQAVGPPVSTDVVGHEWSHGLIYYTARFIVVGEPAALAEATGDIFGVAAEFYAGNSSNRGNYIMGEQVVEGANTAIRRLDNPAATGGANCWYSGIGEIDPHDAAGVGGHFAYLLAEGSGAKSINGVPHNSTTCDGSDIIGIGRAAMEKIWFQAVTVELDEVSTYQDARDATIRVARDRYGPGSTQCRSTAAAWSAVQVPLGDETCGSSGPPGGAGPNDYLNATFNNYGDSAGCADWSGADGTQSVQLPSGKRAWFFSDTYLGAVNERPGFFRSVINNSIVIQNGGSLRTITGGNTCRERDMSVGFWSRYADTPVKGDSSLDPYGWYWSGDATVIGTNVVKFYFRNSRDTSPWIETNTAIATIPVSDLESKSELDIVPTLITPQKRIYGDHPIIWGAGLLEDGQYIYIYGWAVSDGNNRKKLFLARSTAGSIAEPQNWQYNLGGGANSWSAAGDETAAQPVADDLYVEAGYSVKKVDDTYWLFQHEPNLNGGRIVAHPASTPWGFDADSVPLYSPPEGARGASNKHQFYYEARLHEGLSSSPDRLVLSYNVNTSAVSIGCRTRADHDGSIYRPRFVDIPVSLLDPSAASSITNRTAAARDVPQDGRGSRSELPSATGMAGSFAGIVEAPKIAELNGDLGWYDSWDYGGFDGCPPLNRVTSLSANSRPDGKADLWWNAYGRDIWYWVYRRNVTKGEEFSQGVYWVTTDAVTLHSVLNSSTNGDEFEWYVVPFRNGGGGGEAPASNIERREVHVDPPDGPTVAYYEDLGESRLIYWPPVEYPSDRVYYSVYSCLTPILCDPVRTYLDFDETSIVVGIDDAQLPLYVRASNLGGQGPLVRAIPGAGLSSNPGSADDSFAGFYGTGKSDQD